MTTKAPKSPGVEAPSESQRFNALISQVMDIEDITWGDPKKDYLVRFRGRLRQDGMSAANLLTSALRGERLAPIVKQADGRDLILLVSDPLTEIVARVFRIQETTWGSGERANFVVRYRGQLVVDSMEAYDRLAEALRPHEVTPLFRQENGLQAVVLMPGVNLVRHSNPWVNLMMFVLTVLSVLWVGVQHAYQGPADAALPQVLRESLGGAVAFAASLLAILLAHEFGHYLAGRYHKTAVTLPYFLPLPLWPFGTLGAFIQLKEAPKNKRVLLDIGVAGPLAGLVVAIPVLLLGLRLSHVEALPLFVPAGQAFSLEGNSLLYLLAKFAVFGEWLPAPHSYGALSPVLYWLRFFFTGLPLPMGGRDVLIHPVAFAGWGGVLVTSLNLIPAGQLDGGHLIYTLLGRQARRLVPVILLGLVGLGMVWSGWWLWAFLIFFLGRSHAEPLDQITPLDARRKAIAILGLVIFILVFTPVPLQIFAGPLV